MRNPHKGHAFRDGICIRCRSLTQSDYWYERDMHDVVRPCMGVT